MIMPRGLMHELPFMMAHAWASVSKWRKDRYILYYIIEPKILAQL